MASVRPRTTKAGITYQVLYRDGGRQGSQTFVTAKAAEDFRALVEILGPAKALAELGASEADGLTVDELATRFFEHKASDGSVTPRTLDDYRRDYRNWIGPAIGARQANAVDELDVQNLVDSMSRRLDPKSVRDRHMLISSMFKWGSARTRRLVDHNPCGETQLPKLRRKPIRGMTIPEWHAFYATARSTDPDVADMALFLVSTGWRWSEAAALTWAGVADIDGRVAVTVSQVIRRRPGEVGAIVADAKNATSLRANDLGPAAADMLRRRRVGQPIDGFVFTNPAGRKWHQGNFLARHWAPVARATFGEERRPTPHWLRHTHALLLDRSGASTAQMSRRLGHADIKTTVNTYGGLIGDVSPAVLERMDELLALPEPAHDVVCGELV